MKNPTIEQAMQYPWRIDVTPDPDGGYRAAVYPPLPDLELFADTREELEAEWRDALKSHLSAYLRAGKVIPIPYVRMTDQGGGSTAPAESSPPAGSNLLRPYLTAAA